MLERLERHVELRQLKEELRKLGVNFITAGVVGVFINHFVGSTLSLMFWASLWITAGGLVCLTTGLFRRSRI
jgi:hypothetical protein